MVSIFVLDFVISDNNLIKDEIRRLRFTTSNVMIVINRISYDISTGAKPQKNHEKKSHVTEFYHDIIILISRCLDVKTSCLKNIINSLIIFQNSFNYFSFLNCFKCTGDIINFESMRGEFRST